MSYSSECSHADNFKSTSHYMLNQSDFKVTCLIILLSLCPIDSSRTFSVYHCTHNLIFFKKMLDVESQFDTAVNNVILTCTVGPAR